jgi:tuftelin-interacting protein 11
MDVDVDSDADRAAAKDEDSDEGEGGSQPSVPKSAGSPRSEEEMEDRPRMGLGSSKSTGFSGLGFTKAGIGSFDKASETSAFSGFGRGGIGSTFSEGRDTSNEMGEEESGHQKNSFSAFKRGGIGSAPRDETAAPSSEPHVSLPKTFGTTRIQQSFVRGDTDSAGSSRSATPNLSAHERAHFNKLEGSYGARLLAKMGWVSGTGLGTSGEGRVNPVETKVRRKGMGIAFGGFSERTDQEKAEARRKGQPLSEDDEDATPGNDKGKARAKKEPSDAWKRPRKLKTKIEHKTYEEILSETRDSIPPVAGIGPIIDATGSTASLFFAFSSRLPTKCEKATGSFLHSGYLSCILDSNF